MTNTRIPFARFLSSSEQQLITLATITSIDRTFTFCELFSRTEETKNRANIFLKKNSSIEEWPVYPEYSKIGIVGINEGKDCSESGRRGVK